MNDIETNRLLHRITIRPEMLGGRPAIRGMRFAAGDILEMLASGMTNDEILEQHPVLEKDDILAALLYASLKIKNTIIVHAA
jgi:uncharacterized protein (DUF433 family)